MDGCDVRFFGTTHGSSGPPLDTPEAAYGGNLLRFWDHINARAMERGADWRGRTIGEFNEALQRVWTCIGTANFQLNFSAAHEQVAYEQVTRRMTEHTQQLAKLYSNAFDNILKLISDDDANGVPFEHGSTKYERLHESQVVNEVEALDVKVRADLSMKHFAQWKVALERKWADHKANLLILTLDEWLKNYLHKATSLKDERWVQDSEAMQANLDKDLLKCVRADATAREHAEAASAVAQKENTQVAREEASIAVWKHKMSTACILNDLANPQEHGARVMTELILTKVQQFHAQIADAIVANVKESIVVAAAIAGMAPTRRSEQFLREIRLALQGRLQLSGTSALVENLPKADNNLMNCDEQGPLIFTSSSKLSVLTAVLDSLKTHKVQLCVSTGAGYSTAKTVLKLIRDESRGVVSGVILRCGKPCPLCSCPCTKALGHTSSEDDKLHDTYHQPGGLVGSFWTGSNILIAQSCATSVLDGSKIKLKNGTSFPFKKFDKAFPGWAVPKLTQPLPLREYIFATYQDALVEKYGKVKCTNIPPSYNHDLDDVGRTIDRPA